MSRESSVGGRAAEGGSVHRAGVAAYLACYGLAGTTPLAGRQEGVGAPTWLWLETGASVDDLRCRFDSGLTWDVQAKRRCDWGSPLRDTVTQWVDAVRGRGESAADWLVLAVREMSRPVRDLRDALRRLRDGGGAMTRRETDAHERLRSLAAEKGWSDVLDEVTRRATIVQISAESSDDPGFREAAALLDGTVVARGSGTTAVDALARFFHTEAARSGASGIEDWLEVLRRTGIETGPATDRSVATRIDRYRRTLAGRRDLLDVDHFLPGAPPMQVPGLLSGIRAVLPNGDRSPGKVALQRVTRRWPRFAIVGLPGSGKSTALEQLAAWVAGDADAPLPILVRLRRLTSMLRDRQPVDVEAVCRAADAANAEIAPTLADRARDGTAVLLLDGLDECRDQVGAAATMIFRLLANDLPAETGLVLSTREVAADAVAGLPVVTLDEPQHLARNVADLAEHIVRNRDPEADSHDIAAVVSWIQESRSAHPDMWQVPLFAVLLAVHAARAGPGELPDTRAAALAAAVHDSIDRWEAQKADEPSAWHPDLHPEMLLDGFAAIGHLAVSGDADRSAVTAAVAHELERGWDHPARMADAVASDVVRWWIDRVGAFVETDGTIDARLRLMAEVADAMWATARRQPAERAEWLSRVTGDPNLYREPALLAAELAPEVISELLEIDDDPSTALLAAEASHRTPDPPPAALQIIIERLTAAIESPPQATPVEPAGDRTADAIFAQLEERQQRRDGPGWPFAVALCRIPLPPRLRKDRDSTLRALADPTRRVVAAALAAASDCRHDNRPPTDAERAALHQVLRLPAPNPGQPNRRRSRRHFVVGTADPLLTGRADATMQAIRLVGLDDETAERAAAVASRASHSDSARLLAAISDAGYEKHLRSVYGPLTASLGTLAEHDYDDLRFVLREAAALQIEDRTNRRAPTDKWRIAAAAATVEAIDLGEQAVGVASDAVAHHAELARHLVQLAATHCGHPLQHTAEDCAYALGLVEEEPLDVAVTLHLDPYPLRDSEPTNPAVGPDDLPPLRDCVTSGNDWLFWLAARWLSNSDAPQAVDVLWDALPETVPLHRLPLAVWLAAEGRRPQIYRDWMDDDDPILVLAAARHIGRIRPDADLVDVLAADSDLTVRLELLRGLDDSDDHDRLSRALTIAADSEPDRWTCRWCESIESIDVWDCTACSRGDRPDLSERITRFRRRIDDSREGQG